MGRILLASVLIGVLFILYGIKFYLNFQREKSREKKESFVDTSGNELNFTDMFGKFLNRVFENVKFTPANELETTPELEKINTNLDRQLSPMISQGIDALRAASAAQEKY